MIKSVLIVAAALALTTPAAAGDATSLVTKHAQKYNVPIGFALKVARQESNIRCGKFNPSGASGPLQIMPHSARDLGYKGNIRNASCAVQTEYGMKHLSMCYQRARFNKFRAAACHYQGVSAIYNMRPDSARYAKKVLR